MILGDSDTSPVGAGDGDTLDDLFRRAAVRSPDAIALSDPPNRAAFMDGAPLRLTYVEVDRAVAAAAARLRRLNLPLDSVVALQLPNSVEAVIMLLGVLRAGMIAALMPLLWRRADATAALSRVGAKAIVTCSNVGAVGHGDIALHVAADVFSVRYVCAFGTRLADGVVGFGDIFGAPPVKPPPPIQRDRPGAHVASITWDMTADGPVPVARSHTELIAGGRAIALQAGLQDRAAILGACMTGSFAGQAMTVLPWLLTGGRLSLHHPFDAAVLAAQCREHGCDTLVVPGPLVARLAEAGVMAAGSLRRVLGYWRSPERVSAGTPWRHPTAELVPVLALGETAVIALPRKADNGVPALPLGPVTVADEIAGHVTVAELIRSKDGTLAVRGAMVPRHPYLPGATHCFRADPSGYVDTGCPCRVDLDSQTMIPTGPPPGTVCVGGYRFATSELEDLVKRSAPGAVLTALPDALAGHRLAGSAPDRDAVREALAASGANALVADAFRSRGPVASADEGRETRQFR